jgi:very-short-patch-repair endonuclease
MQIRAGHGWLGDQGGLFASTALVWLDVDVPPPRRAEFVVSRSMRYLPPDLRLHTSRRWVADDFIVHRGVRTSNATRAVIDLATVERRAAVIEHAIDAAVRARRTALPLLQRRFADLGGRGRTGSTLLREILLDSGGESFLERRFLRLMREHGLPRPRCQVVTPSTAGTRMRVDFLFGRLVVEVSGRLGHSSDADRRRDARRRNDLQQQGFMVIEFTTADVIDHPAQVVATVRAALASAPL